MSYTSDKKRFRVAAAVIALGFAFSADATAGQFQFGAMIRAGLSGASQWEIGAGASSGSLSATGNVAPYFTDGNSYLFEVGYLKSTNTAYTRVHANTNPASAFSQASYNPAGGASTGADAIWTLPASSFFVTAAPTFGFTAMRLSSLTLQGVSGAVNVIQPIQQTTMTAAQILGFFSGTVTQSQDIVFQADASGSWRLRGVLQMWGLASNGGTASGSQLAFGFGASAEDAHAPEPGSVGLALLGLSLMFMVQRRGK
ncbi:MAG: hypothetical protein SFV51_13815 [Bryobacteraceae bacterium]|nr:hypothetical protein [Bryobacteraceae bacterium]